MGLQFRGWRRSRRRSLPRQAIELLEPRIIGRDVRAVRGQVELRRTLARAVALAARLLALVTLDVSGIAIAIYSGLVVKELVAGRPVFWGLAWRAESAWLPFISLVVVLVFARSHLYGPRGERPGGPAIVSSLALSALVVAVFALATGHRYQTFSIYFWTFAGSAVLVPTLRASFDIVTWSLAHALGQRRRLVVCGSGGRRRSDRGGARRDRTRAASTSSPSWPRPRGIAAAVAEHGAAGRRARPRAGRRDAARRARGLRRRRRAAADRADRRAAPGARDGLRARPGRAAVRGPAADALRRRLARQARVRHRRRALHAPRAVAAPRGDRAAREAHVARARCSTATSASASASGRSRC